MKYKVFQYLLILFFSINVPIYSEQTIRSMNFAWCSCPFSGSHATTADDKVIVTDNDMGRMFLFTLDGHHTGGLGEADKCTKDKSFQPIDIEFIDNQVFATDKATKALKRFSRFGELTETITSKELGFEGKQPYSFAGSGIYYYIGFEGGPLVAYEKDFTQVTKLEVFAISMSYRKGNLWIVTKSGEIAKASENLENWESFSSIGAYLGQFNDATSVRLDDNGNIWISESGNKRVQVFWNDGAMSVWGLTTTQWGFPNIGEDPIEGRFPSTSITSLDISDAYFYVICGITEYKAYAVPKSMLGRKWFNPSCHILELRLTQKSYTQFAKNIWTIQQELYPKAAVFVFLNDENEIYLDGKVIEASNKVANLLAEPEKMINEITPCLESGPCPIQIVIDGSQVRVDLSKQPDAIDCRLVLVEVSGSNKPLLGKDVKVFMPDNIDKVISVKFQKPAKPNVLYAIVATQCGLCLGFAVIR